MNQLHFHTTVDLNFKRRLLYRAYSISFFSICSMGLILLIPLPFPLSFLVFLPAIISTSLAIVPYKRICKHQTQPTSITLTNTKIHLLGEILPIDQIKSIEYTENKKVYGIVFYIDKRKIFLPYFTKIQALQMLEALQ